MTESDQWDAAAAADDKDNCTANAQDAQAGAQDGYPWSQLPVYHADSGVCILGSP